MRFERDRDVGFGSGWRLELGWFFVDYRRFDNHWYFQIMWAAPVNIEEVKD